MMPLRTIRWVVVTALGWTSLLHLHVAHVQAVPRGFIEEGVVAKTAITGAFAVHPSQPETHLLFLSSKEGDIHVLENPQRPTTADTTNTVRSIGNLRTQMCANGERGLQSILPHPNFATNRFLFVFYTSQVDGCPENSQSGPPNRLARFTLDADTLQMDMASEWIIVETPPTPKRVHNGGAMAFGSDGFLYVTTGDASSTILSPDTNHHLFGKILRLDVDSQQSNAAALVPTSNPYVQDGVPCGSTGGTSGSVDVPCAEVFAAGLRNPFRLSMAPAYNNTQWGGVAFNDDAVRFVVGDVGASKWEELNWGGTDYAGTNYMWPSYEGPCAKGADRIQQCTAADASKQQADPFYYYEHIGATDGGCVVGGTFVPPQAQWPAEYRYLFIDFVFGELYNLVPDAARECRSECFPPIPAFRNETFHKYKDMVDMFFGPYQEDENGPLSLALYIVSRDEGQNVRRIRYTGDRNRAPLAVIRTTDQPVAVGAAVTLDGRDSVDPDGDDITHDWSLGDGTTSTQISPTHTFAQRGEYMVTLTVTDSVGQTHQAFVTIQVGTPPTVRMVSPARHSQFRVGQVLRLYGTAVEHVNATTKKPLQGATQLFWEVKQHHGEHYHPFLDRRTGNNFTLPPAPEPEDFNAAQTSHLEVILTAVDSDGLTTTLSRLVRPYLVELDIRSEPSNKVVLVDEWPVTTPGTITSWESHNLRLSLPNSDKDKFTGWSVNNSTERKTVFVVPSNRTAKPGTTITAKFQTNDATEDVEDEDLPGPMTAAPVVVPTPVAKVANSTRRPVAPIAFVPKATPVAEPSPSPVRRSTPVAAAPMAVEDVEEDTDVVVLPLPTWPPTLETEEGQEDNEPEPDNDTMDLIRTTRHCSATNPCGRCEGDCNDDDECEGELICFQKNGGTAGDENAIPGCLGEDVSRTDWCILPVSTTTTRRMLRALP